MSKTIKELADELGYSKTYINQIIRKLGLQNDLQKNGNKFLVNDSIENAIKTALNLRTQTDKRKINDNNSQTDLQFSLRSEIDSLQKQLIVKDQQIEQMTKLLDQQQQLLLNEQNKNQLLLEQIETETKNKKWYQFWR